MGINSPSPAGKVPEQTVLSKLREFVRYSGYQHHFLLLWCVFHVWTQLLCAVVVFSGGSKQGLKSFCWVLFAFGSKDASQLLTHPT